MSSDKTYHRRSLSSPSISFNDPQGRVLFTESLLNGTLESYFPLAEQFITQGDPAFCGIGSLTMALNTLLVDPKRVWKGVWRWFDESMLDCCEPHEIIKLKGITIPKVACLARCNGALTRISYGSDISIDKFREDILRVSSQSIDQDGREVMIVSYTRKALNQTGDGHFSPVGGYHAKEDMVLIMDVARFKYPPHWVPLVSLYEGIKSVDKETGKSRGYILISKPIGDSESCGAQSCCVQICEEESVKQNESTSNDAPIAPLRLQICKGCNNDDNNKS